MCEEWENVQNRKDIEFDYSFAHPMHSFGGCRSSSAPIEMFSQFI